MSQRYLGGVITANPTTPTLASASGVWTLEQQFQYAQTIQPKIVGNSVRFRSSASAYFNRTPASAGSRTTWTWSGWVKRGLSGQRPLMQAGTAGLTYTLIQFRSTDELMITQNDAGVSTAYIVSTNLYRDYSAWYHIVAVWNTASSTSTDRLQLWVNGVRITSFSTSLFPAQNTNSHINNNIANDIGKYDTVYQDGYMAEVNFIDGQALTPSSFGAFDSTGVWQPLGYTGTYGTNGFYLNFSDTSGATATTIGKDYSGNGNNWTPNNISVTAGVTYDAMIDSPTNWVSASGGNGVGNYATFNPLVKRWAVASETFSNANLTVTNSGASNDYAFGTIQSPSGKFYWEMTVTSVGTGAMAIGVDSGLLQYGTSTDSVLYFKDGAKAVGGSGSSYGATYTTNDVIGVALDRDGGTVTFYKNNTSQGTISLPTSASLGAVCSPDTGSTGVLNINFGQRPFTYTPPTGFKALNTVNLPASNIPNGAQYMAATLYTGNASTQTISNGANNPIGATFQPDFVWTKSRSQAYWHNLYDSVRGINNSLASNSTNAQDTTSGTLTAFNANGFTVGANDNGNFTNGATAVAWQWKAGGTAVSNTSGTITSSVSANTTAGFSVVTYTGTGANATVGHGLGAAPSMVIIKSRSLSTEDWAVYHTSIGNTYTLYLDRTLAKDGPSSAWWNSTSPTSSVFSLSSANFNNKVSATYVAYCFAAVAGYSAFGSYTGNGSADGPFVYCGFRPRYILVKCSSGVESWYTFDSSRDTYNVTGNLLVPNQSLAESTFSSFDLLSNGFKVRTTNSLNNTNGGTYIYAAFAENPFNTARAR